jgi:hypothetical protein
LAEQSLLLGDVGIQRLLLFSVFIKSLPISLTHKRKFQVIDTLICTQCSGFLSSLILKEPNTGSKWRGVNGLNLPCLGTPQVYVSLTCGRGDLDFHVFPFSIRGKTSQV